MRRALAIAFAATLAASAAPAASAKLVSDTEIPVRTAGQLTVAFHGDQATGCAARGLCGYSGTVIWQPARSGNISVETSREHGKLEHDVELFLTAQNDPFAPSPGGVTTASVRLQPDASGTGADCADAAAAGTSFSMPIHGHTAVASLSRSLPDVLRTRCAGPLVGDLGRLDVGSSIAVSALLRGRRTIALGSSGAFAARGFAGTATSTVALALGKPRTRRPQSKQPTGRSRLRTVEVDYDASLTGSLVLRTHGDPTSCAPLGACGANGMFSIRPKGSGGKFELIALTRANRPLRDVLTAFGLRKGGNPRGITGFGAFVADSGGRADVTVTRGSNTCRDSGRGVPVAVLVTVAHGVLSAADTAEGPALALRCPGPLLASGATVAAGTDPSIILGRRPATIRLRGRRALNDDGYAGRAVSDLTLTLTHPRVKTTVQSVPTG